jgi:hypothetical protein
MNPNLVSGRLVKDQIWIRRGDYSPHTSAACHLTDLSRKAAQLGNEGF